MVGDRGEVERAALELDLEAGRVVDRLAARELVGVVGGRAHVEDEGVERVLGVDVEVAEVGLARGGAGGLRRRGSFLLRGGCRRGFTRRASIRREQRYRGEHADSRSGETMHGHLQARSLVTGYYFV